MPKRKRAAVFARGIEQNCELGTDAGKLLVIVQKYVPFKMRELGLACDRRGDGLRCGARVDEEEITPVGDRLHEPFHGLAPLGQQASHVVTDTHGERDGLQVLVQGDDDVEGPHLGRDVFLDRGAQAQARCRVRARYRAKLRIGY